MDEDLLNLTKYPEVMYMDVYGNGSKCWDYKDNKELFDVVFKAKYIRADLVVLKVNEARVQAYELAKKELNNAQD